MTGVYKIESISHPDRLYVGSAVNIRNRWRIHRDDLRYGRHHSKKMQRHYNKYGLNDLVFSVIGVCEKKELKPINKIIRPEQFFIWAYNPYFNCCPIAGSRMGCKQKAWNKGIKTGKPSWNSGKKGLHVAWNKGLTGEKSHNFGKKMPTWFGEKISEAKKGKPSSLKGKKQDPEHTRKIHLHRKSTKGYKQTPEQCRVKSDTMKKVWEKRKKQVV